MAKECALCGQKLGAGFPLSFELKDVTICKDCHTAINALRSSASANGPANEYAGRHWQQIKDPRIKTYVDSVVAKSADPQEYADAKARQAEEREQIKAQMIMVTTASVPGYRIVKTGGLVFGETIFKASVLKGLSSDVQDLGAYLSVFSSREMSGVAAMMQQARDFAISKMVDQAIDLGCNAIIGIDCESSAGNNYMMQVSVYGTAALVEKE